MSLVPRPRHHDLTNVRLVRDDEGEAISRPGAEIRQLSVISAGARSGGPVGVGVPIAPDKALREAYYVNVYVYACVQAIAKDLSARPFRVGADPANPQDYDPKHPLAVRLSPPPGGPNPTTSARRLWAWSVAQKVVTGAVAWELDSDLNFWPLPATTFKAICEDRPGMVKSHGWFKEFELNNAGYSGKKSLPPERVFYSWHPAQDNWTRPESVLEAARLDVQVMVMQDIYDNAFLRNDARPATLVVHQAFQNLDEEQKFRRQFLNRHQGPGNAGRVAFATATPAEGGASPKDAIFIQSIGLSQRDAQFIERYDAKLRSVCIAFGVPLSRLGDASKRTFSNADKETLNYWIDTVQPLGIDLQDDVNINLMPKFDNSGNVGWFDWSGVPDLEPPRRFTVPEVVGLVREGLLTDEEGRVELGLPVEPTVGELEPPEPAEPAEPAALPVAASAPSGVTAEQVLALLNDALAPLEAAIRSPELDVPSLADEVRAAQERRARIWRATDRTVRRHEAVWEKRTTKLLNRQRDATLARLTGKRGRQMLKRDGDEPADVDVDAVFDADHWEDETADVYDDLYRAVTAQAFNDLETSIGLAFDVDAPYANKFITGRTNLLSHNLTNTTYDAIKAQLAEGAAKGEGIPELAARIEGLFNVTWKSRPETVARTEVISAYNGSTATAVNEADDVIGGMEWIATIDDVTRPEHADLDGVIIERGETFDIDDVSLGYPGDPNDGDTPADLIVNCRCTIAPVLVDDMPKREHPLRLTRDVAQRTLVELAAGRIDMSAALGRVLNAD